MEEIKQSIKGFQDTFYDNYFSKIIDRVIKPIKEKMEKEEQRLAEIAKNSKEEVKTTKKLSI